MLAVDFLPLVILNINFAEAQRSGGSLLFDGRSANSNIDVLLMRQKWFFRVKTKSGPILAL